jgi:hypothetical protein
MMTTNDITKWMNNNIQVDIAFLDFAKAFDKVAIVCNVIDEHQE